MNTQKGFTLIELLIVVAIIGILATFALPQYSKYQARAKVTAGIAEASALKVAFEDVINAGSADATIANVNNNVSATQNCTLTAAGKVADGTGTITCTLLNAPAPVLGKVITLTRAADSGWTCKTTAAKDYTTTSCPGV
ncbi:pilin [Pseudomonas sp. PB120]|uniref:pilin n=1 Tax=Pseudomonas sp. PB120 TaxID=2494700 RepID=UPI0012FDA470|nr:pilin [Pseudomonas sp. PB120]MVV46909.1 pilin [Pseudomonas sp. PB120]